MKKGWLFLLGWTLLVHGCWYTRDDQGQSSLVSPALAPLALGIAVYNEATETELNVEFVVSSRCGRITPLDAYRFVLMREEGGKKELLIDQFIAENVKKVRHPKLGAGQYAARVFHQDHPQKFIQKRFSINEKTPLILMDVPCLDE